MGRRGIESASCVVDRRRGGIGTTMSIARLLNSQFHDKEADRRQVVGEKGCGTYPRLGPIRRGRQRASGGEGLCRKGRGGGLLGLGLGGGGRRQVQVHGG